MTILSKEETLCKTNDYLVKLDQAKLIGRGGSGYSTATKWQEMVKKNPPELYMAVNGSEGEPGTLKDGFILEHHIQDLVHGIEIAYTIFPQTKKIFIYLRKDYFDKYEKALLAMVPKNLPIEVFREPGGYLCGENTVLCNAIEGKRLEPRRKPPYCSDSGIYGKPTIVNNLETFYRIGEIIDGKYQDKRFYSLGGDIDYGGVFDLPNTITLAQLFKQTGNTITEDHFVLCGGGASGQYFLPSELETASANIGTGAIIVYNRTQITLLELLQQKSAFLIKENCGKCTPCREGVYRIKEMVDSNIFDQPTFTAISEAMKSTSFCGLGAGAGGSFLTLLKKKDQIWK